MKVARIFSPKDIRICDIPTPESGPGEVLCKVVRCGICGTDYSIYTGEFSFVKNGMVKFPMTLGHEWSGIVEKVGSNVENFKPGDRVVGDTGVSCGVCYECLIGQYGRCKKAHPVGTINAWDGAYAEYILMPARHLFHLPDNVSFDNGAMVEPSATALYSVVLGGVKVGSNVLVHGSGSIGIMAAKLAKISGASKVTITGRKEFKLQKSLELGVDFAVNTTKISTDEIFRKYTGGNGFDCIIETSGSLELLKESLKLIRSGGIISVVAFYDKMLNDFDIDYLVAYDITLRAVAGSLGQYMPAIKLMSSGMIDFTNLITGRYKLDEVPKAMQDIKDKNETRIKMMIDVS